MEYDLLIVGNGFDLASGYRTTYSDFLNRQAMWGPDNRLIVFFLDAYRNNFVINDEWNGFENLLCQYLEFLQYLFGENESQNCVIPCEEINRTNRDYCFCIQNLSHLPSNIYSILGLNNPLKSFLRFYKDKDFKNEITDMNSVYNGLGEAYGRAFTVVDPTISKKKCALKSLLEEFERMLLKLEDQLQQFIKGATKKDPSKPKALNDSGAKRVLSFNYSDTAENLFGLSSDKVAHVHGDVSTSIVVGIEPSMITNQSVTEESAFIKFFKRFRRIYKNCNKDYNRKIMNNLTEESIIAIYGHSLDLSDRSILKPFFEKKLQRYDIYCYIDVDAYKIKLVRLIGLDLYDELEKDGKINLIYVE